MKIISLKHSQTKGAPVKVYAVVQSRTRPVVRHSVEYLRAKHARRWLCTCEDFMFRLFAKRRHCDHIKHVREAI